MNLEITHSFIAEVQIGEFNTLEKFYVASNAAEDILASETAKRLRCLKVGYRVLNVAVSEEFPKVPQIKVKIHINPNVRPVIQKYRRVPLAVESKIEEKVKELLQVGIIERLEGPTEWLSPVIPIIKKDGNIRFVIDMIMANQAVERNYYPLPSADTLLSTIGGSVKFSKIDFSNAYFHLELEVGSRNITAFITKSGAYRFTRLMMGIKSAPEEFAKAMDLILAGLQGIHIYMDDILVTGKTSDEHDRNLKELLERLKQNNVKISETKSEFGVTEVEFLGHVVTPEGLKPTLDKIETLRRFKPPCSKEEVKSFLGFLTYLSKFIKDLSSLTYPLRKLLKKNEPFLWDEIAQKCFESLKEAITSEAHLVFFDPARKTRLLTDASPVGLGAILMQLVGTEWRPVAYGSKGLTENEMKFGQTEKEALGVVWAVEKYHYFLYGIHFQILTDCKVLKLLFGPRTETNARIKRWAIRLQFYDYEVEYVPGKENIADCLSRMVDFECNKEVRGKTFICHSKINYY